MLKHFSINSIPYLLFQFIFWTVYISLLFSIAVFFGGEEVLNSMLLIVRLSSIFITSIVLSHIFKEHIQRKKWLLLSVPKLILRLSIGVVFIGLLIQIVTYLVVAIFIDKNQEIEWGKFVFYILNTIIILIIWTFFYISAQLTSLKRKNEIEKNAIQLSLQEAELMILKNQINPHFLFNSLNNIKALIISDSEKSRKMITHISDLLRYVMQFNSLDKVTLSEEIKIVKDYLELESIQLGSRLSYSLDIEEESLSVRIPPMTLQILVENAIKHGISKEKLGGEVHVKTFIKDDFLIVNVVNDGEIIKEPAKEGIGLKNIIERMKLLFGSFADFELTNTKDKMVKASLKIPIV